ncbi:DegV family protein [Kocuria varians]|uniref:DegV family protein n=1 Tax=Kocuria varians TaxID=1272 RepID=UPI0009EE0203|nr:DegV family protein [Kocuria varians]
MTEHGSRSPSSPSHEGEDGLRPYPGGSGADSPASPASSSSPALPGDDDAAAPGDAAEGAARRRRVAVVTDSASALPDAWLSEYTEGPGFAVVDMPVLIEGQLYTHDEADTLSSLVVALAEGRPVTTSRPAPGQLRAAYRRFEEEGYEAVVSIHLSGELSGTVGAARIARQDIGIPVRIVDTASAGLGQGLGVRAGLAAAASGAGIDDVARAALGAAQVAQVLIQVRSFETLRRGGRVNATTARLGSVLQIKPLLSLAEGKIVTVERPVSLPRAKQRFMTLAGEALRDAEHERPVLCLHHVADPNGAREIGEVLRDRYRPEADLVISDLPPVLSAHVGLGTKAAVIEGPTARPVWRGERPAQPTP